MPAKIDEDFFKKYEEEHKEREGIPDFQMNQPIAQNNLVGTIGLELEMEATNSLPSDGHLEAVIGAKSSARWLGVKDGSLRGSAKEFILSKPCTRDEIEPMLKGLFGVISSNRTVLANTNRCSTHVHVNMKGRTINEITSVIALWATFETMLINWCGEDRKTNHFCLSMQDSLSLPNAWETFLRYGQVPGDRNLKYSALNVLPLWDKGSLEFRCGRAADDPKFPVTWATFLDIFVDYACKTYAHPGRLAGDLSERGGWEILEALAADMPGFAAEVRGDMSIEGFNDICMHNFRSVQGFSLEYPWDRWMELIKRPFVPNPFGKEKPKKSPGLRIRGLEERPVGNAVARPDANYVVPVPRSANAPAGYVERAPGRDQRPVRRTEGRWEYIAEIAGGPAPPPVAPPGVQDGGDRPGLDAFFIPGDVAIPRSFGRDFAGYLCSDNGTGGRVYWSRGRQSWQFIPSHDPSYISPDQRAEMRRIQQRQEQAAVANAAMDNAMGNDIPLIDPWGPAAAAAFNEPPARDEF